MLLNAFISSYYIGWLCVGWVYLVTLCMSILIYSLARINSSITSYFAIAWFSQWFLRTRYPRWFVKYNYILGAGASQEFVTLLFDR